MNVYTALKDTPWTDSYVVSIRTVGGRRVMGWPAYGMSPTSSGNWTLFPHSIAGKGLSAVQPGGGGGSGSFSSHLPTF